MVDILEWPLCRIKVTFQKAKIQTFPETNLQMNRHYELKKELLPWIIFPSTLLKSVKCPDDKQTLHPFSHCFCSTVNPGLAALPFCFLYHKTFLQSLCKYQTYFLPVSKLSQSFPHSDQVSGSLSWPLMLPCDPTLILQTLTLFFQQQSLDTGWSEPLRSYPETDTRTHRTKFPWKWSF